MILKRPAAGAGASPLLMYRTHRVLKDPARDRGESLRLSLMHCSLPPESDSSGGENEDDNDSDSSGEDLPEKRISEEYTRFAANAHKLFPPANPLPPQALMYLKEPIRVGANVPLM